MKKYFAALSLFSVWLWLAADAATLPEKLRVISVDLQNSRIETPGTPGSELSQELRHLLEISDADIICIQSAIDWENCERICQLKPGLQVVTCSAFATAPQVAILCRSGAVLSWVEEIDGGSGFALAILQTGARKLGIFTLQSPKAASSTAALSAVATERLLPEVRKLKKFPQNRPDSFLIAGSGIVKSTLLTDNSFQTIAVEPAFASSPEFFIANAGFLTRPRAVTLRGLRTPAVVCDFDTGSSFSSKFAYQTPLLFPGETLASLQAAAQSAGPPGNRTVFWAIGGAVFVLLLLFVLRRPVPAVGMQLVPANGNGAIAPVADEHVRSNLLAWIKSAFLQRLISQRQQLLNNEAEATRRTMVIEERLTNLQSALQTRISAYEMRIDRLEQELTAATMDNRELIRAQIEMLKEKVAKAKQEHAIVRN